MRKLLQNLTIKNKLTILGAFSMFALIMITLISLDSMQKIGHELKQIAEQDIPMTESVTEITVNQLEQAISLERAARFAEVMEADPVAQEHYAQSKARFFELAALVDEEIAAAQKRTTEILQVAKGEEVITEFKHVQEVMNNVAIEHKNFDDHAAEVFSAYEKGNLLRAGKVLELTEAEEEKLDHELEALLISLGKFTEKSAINAEKHERAMFKMLLITAIIALAFMVALTMSILRAVIRPLVTMQEAMTELSSGNLEVEIPDHTQKDEIAEMVTSLQVFRDTAVKGKEMEEEQRQAEIRATEERKQMMRDMADKFEAQVKGIVQSVASSSTELSQAAEDMNKTVETASMRAGSVASASEETASNVQIVASAAEELSSSIQSISEQVSQSTRAAHDSTERTAKADETLKTLVESTDQISNIADLINDIAEQINLLALNATIESARAGEAGKGFAVVASEVKDLATQVAKAVEEVNEQISSVQSVSSEFVTALNEIKTSIESVSEYTNGIASAVEEQSAVTNEIASNMGTAAAGTQEISSNIHDVTQAANDAGSAASQVLQASKMLSEESEKLSSEVDMFLNEVRAG